MRHAQQLLQGLEGQRGAAVARLAVLEGGGKGAGGPPQQPLQQPVLPMAGMMGGGIPAGHPLSMPMASMPGAWGPAAARKSVTWVGRGACGGLRRWAGWT